MQTKYTQEQIDKAKEKLPEELQEALYSMDTAKSIWDICESNDIMDERALKITDYVGYVLIGFILPQEFHEILEKDLKLPKKIATEVARELNRFVFYPVKPALEQLHRMEIEVSAKIVTPKPEDEEKPEEQKSEQKPRGDDSYREPLE